MANILIIDDDQSTQKTLYTILRHEGHQIVCTENAQQAMEKLEELKFDLVIVDIHLPDMQQNEMLQQIHEKNQRVATILITATPEIKAVINGIRAGVGDYLTKPIKKEALLRSISRTIKQKSLQDLNKQLAEENLLYQDHLESIVIKKNSSLSSFLRRNIELQDQERSTLGHRVYEYFCQPLKNLQLAWQELAQSSGNAEETAVCKQMLSNALDAARSISCNLNPMALKESGISRSVISNAELIFRNRTINYTINLENTDSRFSEQWGLHLYRILEEIMQNCIRHSDASSFALSDQQSTEDLLIITARDNGKGILEETIEHGSRGMGLLVVQERTRMIEGQLEIDSSAGTRFTLTFPFQERKME